jgi:hypothetical protein
MPNTIQQRQISIPLVCDELGLPSNGKRPIIQNILTDLWRQKYKKMSNESPPKRDTYYRGKPCVENQYFQNDYDIMEQAIRSVQWSLYTKNID